MHQPSLFHNFEVSRGGLNRSLKNLGFICDALVHMRTYHLAMKHEYIYIYTQDCIVNMFVCIRQGESLSSIIDSVFEPSLINDSSVNTLHASAEEACEHRLAAP